MDNTALSLDDFPSMESESFRIPSMNNTLLSQDDFSSMKSKPNKTPSMDNTLLSLDDFPSRKSKSNMTPPIDCLRSGLIAEQLSIKEEERVTQNMKESPQVLDHQEKIIPMKKGPRKITKQLMIENNSEDQQHKSDDDRGNRKRVGAEQKRKRNIPVRAEVPVRELDNEFKNLITSNGGSLESLKLVIQKTLFKTNVKPEEGRFLIPRKKMINGFLKEEEDTHLDNRTEDKMNEKRVMLIEPLRQVSQINLRKWFMRNANGNISWSYVLVTDWNEVVERNGLKKETVVQLWAFRAGAELGFALVKL